MSAPRTAVLLALAALGLVACGSGTPSDTGDVAGGGTVLATTSIWADVVGNLTCNEVEVTALIPNGADVHAFELSLSDRARLEEADLVVANGLRLEGGLADILASLDAPPGETENAVVSVSDYVETIPFGATIGHSSDHDDEERNGADPHLWWDPTKVADAVPHIADAVIDRAGLDPTHVRACADAYVLELQALDAEVGAIVASLPPERRTLVTSHDSLGYFAAHYGFEVVGTVLHGSTGLEESTAAQLGALVEAIRRTGTQAVFVEPNSAANEAQAIAHEVDGLSIVPLVTDALGDRPGVDDTYLGLVRTNAQTIVDALT